MIDMKGGARNRSGPPADPNSGRSDRRGLTLTALPTEGYSGEVPDLTDYLPVVTDRHEQVWSQLWSTPQACAWAGESWRWPVVADLARCMVRSQDPDAPAAWTTSIRQLRDDVGLSKAGLTQNGWAIAVDEVSPKREDKPAKPASSRDRMKVVKAGGA